MLLEEKVQYISSVLKDKKAIDVKELKIDKSTILTDYFIICSGTSVTHVKALSDELFLKMKNEKGIECYRVEGYESARWILLDFGDVVVHIFHREDRAYYNLEKLWKDGVINISKEDLSEMNNNFNKVKNFEEDYYMDDIENLNDLDGLNDLENLDDIDDLENFDDLIESDLLENNFDEDTEGDLDKLEDLDSIFDAEIDKILNAGSHKDEEEDED